MALKKRSRVTAQFNMSSLTDIIFLLLIFFMLTSSLVTPNALNLKLPGKTHSTPTATDNTPTVRIDQKGNYRYNGHRVSIGRLLSKMQRLARKRKPVIVIEPDPNAPVESVVTVMDMAMRHHIETIMAAEE